MHPLLIGILGALVPLALPTARNLEYEYATLMGWLLGLLALFCKDKNFFKSIFWIIFASFSVNLIAIAILPKSCNSFGSIAWYFIQVVPSVVFYRSLRDSYQKKPISVGIILLASILFSATLFLWLSPQKRWVSLWLGYLHGPVYDQFIPLTSGVILARMSHLFLGFYIHLRKKNILLVSLIFFGISLADPINQHGKSSLDRALPKTLSSENIGVHFQEKNQLLAEQIFKEAQFHALNLTAQLGISISKPIQIYIYPDQISKKIYFGGSETDITDVVMPSIHILAEPSPHSTLRHEMVHALLSTYAPLGFNFNMVITEGIAMALAPHDSLLSMDVKARHLLEEGTLPDLNEMFGPLFFLKSNQISYSVSGSFIAWLLKAKDPRKFLEVYSGKSFSDAYQENRENLYSEWQTYLKEVPYDAEKIANLAKFLLDTPSVFSDICPHSKVDRYDRSSKSLLSNEVGSKQDFWEWLELVHPDDGQFQIHQRSRAREKSAMPSNIKLKDDIKTIQDFENHLLQADIFFMNAHLDKAIDTLSDLKKISLNPGRNLKRALEIRFWILDLKHDKEKADAYSYLLGRSNKSSFQNNAIRYLDRRANRQSEQTAESLNQFGPAFPELNRQTMIINYQQALNRNDKELAFFFLDQLLSTEPANEYWQIEKKRVLNL